MANSFKDNLERLNNLRNEALQGGGPERVIDVIEARAPEGFEDLNDIASYEELEGIVKGYSTLAGFEKDQVNT